MSKFILAIDQGTTSTRAILFDENGHITGISQKELQLYYPDNGWVEQNPEDIWADTQYVCQGVMQQHSIHPSNVLGIGITNQRETTIVWDRKTGEPVYNAIVWQDRRTHVMCENLRRAGHEDIFARKTGLLLDPYFSGTKIRWILDNVEGAAARAKKGELAFGTIDCFLLWRLTGGKVHATDITNASRTLLYNIVEQKWDEELLKILGIPASMLPEVKDNSGDFGEVSADFLGAPTRVTGMAGDQQAALVGQACFKPGMVKSTYGTGCFALMNIGAEFKRSNNKMLTTVAYRLKGEISYAVEGSIFVAGAAVQWLRDGLGIIKSSSETEKMALSVEDNGGVYLVPAFTGLGAPYWNPHARASISGLTRGAKPAHIVRAALEAQAYQTEDLMRAMAEDAGYPMTEIRVDGGMVKNSLVCQLIADITSTPVLRPTCIETTALGAAYLAGLHVGLFSSTEAIAEAWECEQRFSPKMASADRERLYAGWQQAVKQVLA
ncbi:MAG TPA: glycerol kinase GlpK [Patescibacteria group bacterium]|nr:glycerol kinase GlpK [Patescibacteria group bacterium]